MNEQQIYVVFGETTQNTTASNYTYANALTLDIMQRLGDDERFLECNQADVLNLAIVILYGFVGHDEHNKISKAKLHEFVEDFNEFKDFSMITMNTCRRNNVAYNSIIDDLIEQEVRE